MMNPCVGLLLALSACLPSVAAPPAAPSQAEIEDQQRASVAQSLGHPTRKSPDELEATIQTQTKDFKLAERASGQLDAPAPYTIDAIAGTCYTVVLRLADGATWGRGAEAGLRFDFESPTGRGSGGPGVVGPGAVASVGCAEASGAITLVMAPMVGRDPIGSGDYALELWSHRLTREEAARREADKQRQITEQREFAEREEAKRQQRAVMGCSKCDARYQGCVGAGRSTHSCQSEYRSCAFREVGADYVSACPSAR